MERLTQREIWLRERLIQRLGIDHVITLEPITETDYDRTPLEALVDQAEREVDMDMEHLLHGYSPEELAVIQEVTVGKLAKIYERDYQDRLTINQFAESQEGSWHAYATLCEIAIRGDLAQYGIKITYTDILDWYKWSIGQYGLDPMRPN